MQDVTAGALPTTESSQQENVDRAPAGGPTTGTTEVSPMNPVSDANCLPTINECVRDALNLHGREEYLTDVIQNIKHSAAQSVASSSEATTVATGVSGYRYVIESAKKRWELMWKNEDAPPFSAQELLKKVNDSKALVPLAVVQASAMLLEEQRLAAGGGA